MNTLTFPSPNNILFTFKKGGGRGINKRKERKKEKQRKERRNKSREKSHKERKSNLEKHRKIILDSN
jgi:hypothetical protein